MKFHLSAATTLRFGTIHSIIVIAWLCGPSVKATELKSRSFPEIRKAQLISQYTSDFDTDPPPFQDSLEVSDLRIDSLTPSWFVFFGAGSMLTQGRRLTASPCVDVSFQKKVSKSDLSLGITLQASPIGTVAREEGRPGGTMVLGGISTTMLLGNWGTYSVSASLGMFGMLYKYWY